MPTGWVVALVALLMLALPFAVFGSLLGGDDRADADLAAVLVSDDDDDGGGGGSADDERDRNDGGETARETKDANTLRNGDNSVTGNTRGADTTRATAAAPVAPAAQGFAPAYAPVGDGASVSGGASASG